MNKIILVREGKPKLGDSPVELQYQTLEVPVLFIGDQVVALGHGRECWAYRLGTWRRKDKNHLYWKLDGNKIYRVTIEEVSE